jgi:hypothetical protein
MGKFLHNISILFILFGIILFVHYMSSNTSSKCDYKEYDEKYTKININNAYSMKPSEIFNTMFTKPNVWQGYDSVNVLNKSI